MSVAGPVLFYLGGTDANYTKGIAKSFSRFQQVFMTGEKLHGWGHVQMYMKSKGCKLLATTRFEDVKSWSKKHIQGTKEDNLGYHFERDDIRVVLLPDIKRSYTNREGQFIIDRYLQKLSNPERFIAADPFTYTELDGSNLARWVEIAHSAFACAVDIETSKDGRVITSCSWTFGIVRDGTIRTKTCVVRVTPETFREAFTCIRRLNATPVPKITQNGRYDATYFLRFGAPMHAWLFDTYHMQHSLYAELAKDLGYLSSFYLLNFHYWKEEAGVDLYQYNAKDTHNTFWIFMAQLLHTRERGTSYGIHNYLQEFPLVFPSLHCGQEGILVDDEVRQAERAAELSRKDTASKRLGVLTGLPGINPNSPLQMKALLNGLGFKTDSTDAKTLQSFAEASPLNERIHDLINDYRESGKAISTYYDVELLGQRLLYELDPAATDTGRLGSKASNYWCGTQIQNIPPYFKNCLVADPGWELFEVDKSQAESWCTGYLSQDSNLMHTLHTSPDFHCTNASLFFGIPFNELYQTECLLEDGTNVPGKVLRKDIRNVAKRVNHGANYNMGWFVLWQTMGTKAVLEAKNLLQLPRSYGIRHVCEYLLECFKRAYPRVKGDYYKEIIQEVRVTGKLTGPTGWTRKTFLKPWETKPDLNACVAHPAQSLSVMLVNKSFYRAWRELQLVKYAGKLRLKAQIHDSLFGQYRVGHEYIVKEIEDMMAVPCKIHGRVMTIPSDSKWGATSWSGLKD